MGAWKGTVGVLVALASGCGSSAEPLSETDAPLRVVGAARSPLSPGIEVESVEGGFVVNNRTSSPIVCGAIHSIGVTPRKTVRVAADETVRIDDSARHVVACEIDMKTAAEIAGETEEEWRPALGVSPSEQMKLVIFEERGTTSSSTAMLASSCELEPMDDGPRTQTGLK